MAPSHVLVALDGSPLADDALRHALETFDSDVTALNVVTPVDASMSESGVLETGEDRRAAARERSERLLADARGRPDALDRRANADATGVDRTVEIVVEPGDPAETILAAVDERDVDHVVLGGHGGDRHDAVNRLLGTVATTVVSESPVTVTVVR